MVEWLEFVTTDSGYYDPETGQDLASIDGLNNGPGQRFDHKGIVYPDISNDRKKIISWHEKGSYLLIESGISSVEADSIVSEGKFSAIKRTAQEAEAIKRMVFRIQPAKDNVAS